MKATSIYCNGINGVTGEYLLLPGRDALAFAECNRKDEDASAVAMLWSQKPKAGLPHGLDPRSVGDVGWGIVFHAEEDKEVVRACEPLVEARGKDIPGSRIKVLDYRNGEEVPDWLARHDVGLGDVEPDKVPYYLLVVGDPKIVPLQFVQHLALQYSVGCIHFDDLVEYKQYVCNVLDHENRRAPPHEPRLKLFAPCHDPATELSLEYLVKELLAKFSRWSKGSELMAGDATKERFLDSLANDRFDLLFSASHGLAYPLGDDRQSSCQGAILCQNWPGRGAPRPEHFISANDEVSDFDLSGKVFFNFACFSSGTPERDRFLHINGVAPPPLASHSFYSGLSKRLLSKEKGALAVIGHVDRAWGYSLLNGKGAPQVGSFANALSRILAGEPIGLALKDFRHRYAAYSLALSRKLEDLSFGRKISDDEISELWIQRNDSEGYHLFGDPATRLNVSSDPKV